MMKVVLDTSCISAFILAERMPLLFDILEKHEIVITGQVYQELKLSKKPLLKGFSNPKMSIVEASSSLSEQYNLHIGEASVISYAKQNKALAVIDDKKARTAAEREGINFVGTATLVKLGIENGILKQGEIEELVNQLTTVGRLYFSDEIKRWIVSK